MGARHQPPLRFSLGAALLTLLITTILLISSADSVSATTLKEDDNSKVTLEFYYETLCPYCSRFVVSHLYKLFGTGIIAITDLKLIPYGNAKLASNGTIICQHGAYECLLNTVEACAIDVWPEVNGHFPFIYCVETLVYQGKSEQWKICFKMLGLDSEPVNDCLESGRGLQLELKYAAETNALQPPHTYVPWVVVDGQPLYDDYENFLSYICKAYKGTPVPSACNQQISIPRKQKWHLKFPVCYRETTSSKLSGVGAVILSLINKLMY